MKVLLLAETDRLSENVLTLVFGKLGTGLHKTET